jgi:hypothetical protein
MIINKFSAVMTGIKERKLQLNQLIIEGAIVFIIVLSFAQSPYIGHFHDDVPPGVMQLV